MHLPHGRRRLPQQPALPWTPHGLLPVGQPSREQRASTAYTLTIRPEVEGQKTLHYVGRAVTLRLQGQVTTASSLTLYDQRWV